MINLLAWLSHLLAIGGEGYRSASALLGEDVETGVYRGASIFPSIFDCVGVFIIISCYIFQLCSYDHDTILQWIWLNLKCVIILLNKKHCFEIYREQIGILLLQIEILFTSRRIPPSTLFHVDCVSKEICRTWFHREKFGRMISSPQEFGR